MASTETSERAPHHQVNRALEVLADVPGTPEADTMAELGEVQAHAMIAGALFIRDAVLELRRIADHLERIDDALRNTVGGRT